MINLTKLLCCLIVAFGTISGVSHSESAESQYRPMRYDVPSRPVLKPERIRMRVTACSPEDPKDRRYYATHGYEGAIYNIAADRRIFPTGTKMRIPGYMSKSYPNKFWTVDSGGGSVIRASTRKGVKHIDVKFRTLYSAKDWGSRWLTVEVVRPDAYKKWLKACAEWDAKYGKL